MFSVRTPVLENTFVKLRVIKHERILYNDAEVLSLQITNPNRRAMLPFDWLITYIHVTIFINPRSHMTIQNVKRVSDEIEKGAKKN